MNNGICFQTHKEYQTIIWIEATKNLHISPIGAKNGERAGKSRVYISVVELESPCSKGFWSFFLAGTEEKVARDMNV